MPIDLRIAAISAALPIAADAERAEIAPVLCDLATAHAPGSAIATDAVQAMLSSWPHLDRSSRSIINSLDQGLLKRGIERVAADLERGVTTEDSAARAVLVDLPRPVAVPLAIAVLRSAIARTDARAAREAEYAILRMAASLLPRADQLLFRADLPGPPSGSVKPAAHAGDPPEATRGIARDFAEDLADLAWSYADHGRSAPLLAAIMLLDGKLESPALGPAAKRLARLVSGEAHPAASAALRVLRRTRGAGMRLRAWQWLAIEDAARSAIDRVAEGSSRADHEVLCRNAHLACRPLRAARASLVSVAVERHADGRCALKPGAVLPASMTPDAHTAQARRGLVRLLSVFSVPSDVRQAMIAPMSADPDSHVRFSASRLAVGSAASDFVFDRSEPVARSAVLRWSRLDSSRELRFPLRPADRERSRIASLLSRSPHASLRSIASDERGACSPWIAGSLQSAMLARRWRSTDPAGFRKAASERLRSQEIGVALGALGVIARLGVASGFTSEIIEIAGYDAGVFPGSERIAATATGMLHLLRAPAASDAIHAGLFHADDRVRANAVESAGRLGSRAGAARPALIELKHDANHRVRANAVRALLTPEVGRPRTKLYESAAVASLIEMIEDVRPLTRAAGLWASERVLGSGGRARIGEAWRDIAARVVEISSTDSDPRSRMRARRTALRLAHEIEHGVARSSAGSSAGSSAESAVESSDASRTASAGLAPARVGNATQVGSATEVAA
ncbi:MAG: HEAT repeat domain-containing protein [Planctomycetota bacterium]